MGVGEAPPGGDDPSRVGAELDHVDELDLGGVVPERVAEQVDARRRERGHHGLSRGQALTDERHGPGQELLGAVPEERLVPVAVMGPAHPGGPWLWRGDPHPGDLCAGVPLGLTV